MSLGNSVKFCPKCKNSKPLEEFYRSRNNKDGRHGWCKLCQKHWAQENRVEQCTKVRCRRRKEFLIVKGRRVHGLNKRPYTGRCETCGRVSPKHLNYHHWEDNNPSKGIWVCFSCHMLIEAEMSGRLSSVLSKYKELKEKLNVNS